MPEVTDCPTEADTRRVGSMLVRRLKPGDLVLLEGPLGSGKTTFVRGALEALGHEGPVRSPTFNLVQFFETEPPVLHADLYRVPSAAGLGIEEKLDTHIAFVEWGDRAPELFKLPLVWRVQIAFADSGRRIEVLSPSI